MDSDTVERGLTEVEEKEPAVDGAERQRLGKVQDSSDENDSVVKPDSGGDDSRSELERWRRMLGFEGEISGIVLEVMNTCPWEEIFPVEKLAEGGDSKCLVNGSVDDDEQNGCGEVEGLELSDGVGNGVQVIDESVLVEPVTVPSNGYECGSGIGLVGSAEEGVRSMNQALDGKKAKRARRRKGRKGLQVDEGQGNLTRSTMDEMVYPRNRDGPKITYSREEMEAMRFLNVVEQQQLWKVVYNGLGIVVAKEYDDLGSVRHQNQFVLDFDPRQRFTKKEHVTCVLGGNSSENVVKDSDNIKHNGTNDANTLDHACSESVGGEDGYTDLEEECVEDYDSEEDYASIQRPAFMVAGEPNFDAGPVEDGFEYLRRVRWEAAHIPKVKVAKLDRSKLNKEQSIYMPQIEDIAKCPEHLLPLKQWEEAFLADFSELRLAFSRLEDSKASNMLSDDDTILESDRLTSDEAPEVPNPSEKPPGNEIFVDYPKLSTILALEPVARVSMLRKRISATESMTVLSRDDCAWLFALCAAVDTPLNADTCASLRGLLRKCAGLRSAKREQDDELGMLNILITVSGRYFGQLE